jgi:hypothetical protein
MVIGRPTRFVLLAEQYNSLYPAQVTAMEERAKALGMGGQLYYMCVLVAVAPQPLLCVYRVHCVLVRWEC